MNSPMFSIVIPLYNKENNIAQTVESVLNQTIVNFEILIVDDGSKDHSVEIVEKISDDRIRLIQQINGGVSKARNRGIREAKGQYICFLDADDLWKSDFLETVNLLIEEFPEAKMFCPSYQVVYKNRVVHPKWRSVDLEKDSLVSDFFEMATAPFWICNSSCVAIVTKELLQMDHWFPERETVYEDLDLWIRIGANCKVAHSNKICSTYQRMTENNAREFHTDKVVYSKSYMETLDKLISDPAYSKQQKEWLHEIRDRRMVPYIMSLILTENRNRAKQVLTQWRATRIYRKYYVAFLVGVHMPRGIVHLVQNIRLGIF